MAEIVNINSFDIRFEIHGEGIPIVYTPGGFYPLEKGRLIAERLKPLGYKVLLWDRPNTGELGLLFEGGNLLRIWADKLRELLYYTGLSPAFVSARFGRRTCVTLFRTCLSSRGEGADFLRAANR